MSAYIYNDYIFIDTICMNIESNDEVLSIITKFIHNFLDLYPKQRLRLSTANDKSIYRTLSGIVDNYYKN